MADSLCASGCASSDGDVAWAQALLLLWPKLKNLMLDFAPYLKTACVQARWCYL